MTLLPQLRGKDSCQRWSWWLWVPTFMTAVLGALGGSHCTQEQSLLCLLSAFLSHAMASG